MDPVATIIEKIIKREFVIKVWKEGTRVHDTEVAFFFLEIKSEHGLIKENFSAKEACEQFLRGVKAGVGLSLDEELNLPNLDSIKTTIVEAPSIQTVEDDIPF